MESSLLVKLQRIFTPKVIVALYAAIAMVLGSFWIFSTQMGESPDVWLHYYRIDSILNGDIFPHKVNATSNYHSVAGENFGGAVSWDVVNLSVQYNGWDSGVVHLDSIDTFTDKTADLAFNNTAIYNPIGYTPYLITLAACNLLQLPPDVAYYAMEFIGLLFCVVLTALALYFLPKYRIALLLVLLLPYIPLPFGSFSYTAYSSPYVIGVDATVFATAILFTCLLFRAYWQEQTARLLIWMVIVGTICALSKFSYAPLVLASLGLLFVLPKVRHKQLIIILGCGAAFFVTLAWMKINGGFATSPGILSYADVQQKNAMLLTSPLTALSDVFTAIINHQSYYGRHLQGYMILAFEIFLSLTLLALIVIFAIKKVNAKEFGFLLICLISAAGVLFAVYLALWLQYTAVDVRGVVEGVQSRYFVPAAPIVLLVACALFDKLSNKQTIILQNDISEERKE